MAKDLFKNIPKLTQITYERLTIETNEQLSTLYNRSGKTLSPASPYGQIINVQKALQTRMFEYMENVLAESSIIRAQNATSIRGHAVSSGYIPGRSISANGSLKLTIKLGINIPEEIPGSKIIIINKTMLSNKSNRLNYVIKLGGEQTTYTITPDTTIILPIIQGKMQRQTKTGDGTPLQSYKITTRGSDIEQFNVIVTVNGELYSQRVNLIDILPNEKACVVQTSLDGDGIDIIFGNGDLGYIPEIGTIIQIDYLITEGSQGIINIDKPNDWTFVDDVYDAFGNTITPEDIFNIQTHTPILYGANADSVSFIRAVLPYVSRNFVLALPDHFSYALRRLGQFSYVDAFTRLNDDDPTNDRTIFLYVVPNIKILTTGGVSYFDIPLDRFILDSEEKKRILNYIKGQGTIVLGTEVEILDLKIARYIIYLFVRVFEDANESEITESIMSAINDYFIAFARRDRVPGSDLIRILDGIEGIDSVNIRFVSEKNEVYHANAEIYKQEAKRLNPSLSLIDITVPGYDSNITLGLDRTMEEILLDKGEIPIIRGGWKDRKGIEYNEAPIIGKKGPVNIIYDKVKSVRRIEQNTI